MSAYKMFPAPPAPWEEDVWADDQLSEQDFWLWLARTHGRLAAQRAWEAYWCPDTWDQSRWDEPDWAPSRTFSHAFDGISGAVENWIYATTEDERTATRFLRVENAKKVRSIRWNLFWVVRVLLRCTFRGDRILESGEAVMLVVDTFMTQRNWVKAEDVWDVPPTAEQMEFAVEMMTLSWKILNLSDERFDALRAHA